MGRSVKDARLQDRAARLRLAMSADIYWRSIAEGCHLGYYKGSRGGKWVARFRAPGAGKGYVKARIGEADDVRDADGSGVLDWRQAQEKARAWFDERSRRDVVPRGPFTVGDALDEYLEHFPGKAKQSAKYRIDALIRPKLGDIEVVDLDRAQIRAWHRDRAAAPLRRRTRLAAVEQNHHAFDADDPEAVRKRRATANRDLTVLKAALNRAADDRDYLPVDAWRSVKPFADVEVARRRYLDDAEVRRLVNAVAADFRPLVQASVLTGGRYGELSKARVRDYDRKSHTLLLAETKNATPRRVYLDAEGASLLDTQTAGKMANDLIFARTDGKAWSASQQARPIEEACVAGKVDRCTFHDLRRTFGARLARKGVPMAVIAEAMGHKDERITRKHYAHLAPSYVSETVRAAVAGMGIVEAPKVVPLSILK